MRLTLSHPSPNPSPSPSPGQVRHLEQCLRKEIERHDGVAAQLAASSADAQMRLAMAGLQVQH